METTSRYLLTFLLNASWQVPLITAAGALAVFLMRRGPAAYRHAVWFSALVAAFLLPLASIRTARSDPGMEVRVQYEMQPPALAAAVLAPAPRKAPSLPRSVNFGQTTAKLCMAGYIVFVLWRAIRLVRSFRRTVAVMDASLHRSPSPKLEDAWNRCLTALQLRDVDLRVSHDVSGPVTAGFLHPTIILPETLFSDEAEDVLLTAVGHEMAHIARRDFAMNLLCEFLTLPLSFHPAAWILRRKIDHTREIACDELVVRRVLNAKAYARSIVNIAARLPAPVAAGAALGVLDGDILEERIRRLAGKPASWRHARALLITGLSGLAVCGILLSSLALSARAQGAGAEEMKLAEAAYNTGDFAGAVTHFESAVKLSPANLDAKVFLANALLRLYFVKREGPESPLLTAAARQYESVLATDPRSLPALRGMSAVNMHARKLREARDWTARLIQAEPGDATSYYTAAVLDWGIIYPDSHQARLAAGGRPQDAQIPDAGARRKLRETHGARLEEGFRNLEIAIRLDPGFADAMAYLNLLYRLKAAYTDDASEAASLITLADAWVAQAIAAKRQRPQSPSPNATLDISGPPPGPPSPQMTVSAPPPPPPPPPGRKPEQ